MLSTTKQIYVIIYPTGDMEGGDEIHKKCEEDADKIAEEIFGINYKDDTRIPENIRILKNLSDCEIQRRLAEKEIYVNLQEAQQYEYDSMRPEIKSELKEFSIESWGKLNKDFLRCVLNYCIIKHIIITNHRMYKLHSMQAIELNANPIFNRDEWEPFLYEMAGCSYPASDEFKYMCAVHRNDKMSMMVQMSAQEIEKYRYGKDAEIFRDFLCSAVKSIHDVPDHFDEISKSVFEKFDSLLESECKKIEEMKKKSKSAAIWGIGKAVLGYVPYISYLVTTVDLGVGIKNFSNLLGDQETILEAINKRNSK